MEEGSSSIGAGGGEERKEGEYGEQERESERDTERSLHIHSVKEGRKRER